ncbi:MAG TPA: hypothetical protein VF043_26170 [Ktedonobacteraceae bacterium]
MIIKMQPKELDRKPLISERDPHKGDSEVYMMSRVIVEFWCEGSEECEEPAFAWSVDDPDQPSEEWLKLLLSAVKGATRHIEDVYRVRQKGATLPGE